MKKILKILTCSFLVLFISSCATTTPQPLTYLALEKPKGIIETKEYRNLEEKYSRGGFYFLNYGFRPAADINSYLEQAENRVGSSLLRNADIQLNVPFAIDILLFGYNGGTDTVTIGK